MEEILKKVEDFSEDEEILGAYDAEWHKQETERVVRLAALEEAEEKGSLNKSYEIAQNMLKKNIDMEIISEVTGLNIDQIKKLESN